VEQVDYACDNFSLYVGQTWSLPIGLGSSTLRRNIYIHPQLGILGIDEASSFSQQDYTAKNQSKFRLASFSKDHNQSDECCGGEDLHKEDHEKAGPSPQNPASPGFVDYKLEWERESERLKGIREEIAREKLRHQGWDLERVEQAEKIERIGTELKTIRTAMEQCMAMGEELDRELESRRKTLKGLDASLANLHNERKSVELQIEEKGRELVEMNQKYAELEKEYEPIAIKLAVPHLKGWHYEAEYGWLFVEVGSYPYVFSQRTDSWIYYKQGSHQPWEYFDYPSQKWIQWQ